MVNDIHMIRTLRNLKNSSRTKIIDGKVYMYRTTVLTPKLRDETKLYLETEGIMHRFFPLVRTINGQQRTFGWEVFVLEE